MDSVPQDRLDRLRETADEWFKDVQGVAPGAVIETAFLMAAADGDLSPLEYDQLLATIGHITAKQVPDDQLRTMVAQLVEALRTDGWEKRIAGVAEALPDPIARRSAYRVAAGVSFIDGEVQEDEEQLFGLLAQAFAIPVDEATAILASVRDELYGAPDADAR